MFKERLEAKTKVELISAFAPALLISTDALNKMRLYVEQCDDEIGWLGTIDELSNNTYHLTDVYLFKQQVHATTTEITSEGLTEFAEEILELPDGMDTWNSIRAWGHSHVNMGVTPSGQDDKQMLEFKQGGHPYFFRIIANKKGELKVDFYNYETGVSYHDVNWERYELPEELEINSIIEELYSKLEEIQEKSLESHRNQVSKEMKEKVSKLVTYTTYPKNTWFDKWSNKGSVSLQPFTETHVAPKVTNNNRFWDEEFFLDSFTSQDFWIFDSLTNEELTMELEAYGYHHTEFTQDDLTALRKFAGQMVQEEQDNYGDYNIYGG